MVDVYGYRKYKSKLESFPVFVVLGDKVHNTEVFTCNLQGVVVPDVGFFDLGYEPKRYFERVCFLLKKNYNV